MTKQQAINYLYSSGMSDEQVNTVVNALEKQKRGLWMPIQQGDRGYSAGDFICSCCGKPNKCYSLTDYCCNCGAKMEGEQNE